MLKLHFKHCEEGNVERILKYTFVANNYAPVSGFKRWGQSTLKKQLEKFFIHFMLRTKLCNKLFCSTMCKKINKETKRKKYTTYF